MALVFISHAHTDELLARKVAALLGDALGLHPADFFLSSQEGRGVAPAASIRASIMEELRNVPALLVLLTPRAAASPWVWLEAGNRLGCVDRPPPIFMVPSARFVPLLAPVSDMRALQLDNDGELHELVQAVGRALDRAPHNVLSYKPALRDVMQASAQTHSLAVEKRQRAMSWIGRHALSLVLITVVLGWLAYGSRSVGGAPGEVVHAGMDGPALWDLNEMIVRDAARFLLLKGQVTAAQQAVHGATVMVSRDGEILDPAGCEEPECTAKTTLTDGAFTIDLTRIGASNGDRVVMSVVKPGFQFFSRELEVDVRAMDVRAAPQNIVLASQPSG